jgi:hypothetical protein
VVAGDQRRRLLRGYSRPGVRLGVASKHAGASINDVTDEQFADELTGTAALSGQRSRSAMRGPS